VSLSNPLTDHLSKHRQSFLCSELGRLHAVLPLKALADEIGLKENFDDASMVRQTQ
jgi:hypothetical protein